MKTAWPNVFRLLTFKPTSVSIQRQFISFLTTKHFVDTCIIIERVRFLTFFLFVNFLGCACVYKETFIYFEIQGRASCLILLSISNNNCIRHI